jgi:hypothetical protein
VTHGHVATGTIQRPPILGKIEVRHIRKRDVETFGEDDDGEVTEQQLARSRSRVRPVETDRPATTIT